MTECEWSDWSDALRLGWNCETDNLTEMRKTKVSETKMAKFICETVSIKYGLLQSWWASKRGRCVICPVGGNATHCKVDGGLLWGGHVRCHMVVMHTILSSWLRGRRCLADRRYTLRTIFVFAVVINYCYWILMAKKKTEKIVGNIDITRKSPKKGEQTPSSSWFFITVLDSLLLFWILYHCSCSLLLPFIHLVLLLLT